MKSREDVIKGLADIHAHFRALSGIAQTKQGRAGHLRDADFIADAMTLLQAQAPRVLSYDEARNHAMQYMNPDSVKPLFIEFRIKDDEDEEELRPPWRGGYNQRCLLAPPCDRYGIDFRFWTDRPTKEQMEATSWETKTEKP